MFIIKAMRCSYKLSPHRFWIDLCWATASPEGAALHLDWQASSENTTNGCNIPFGSTLVKPNEMLHPLVMFSLYTCRTKCNVAPAGADVARHLLVQMWCGNNRWTKALLLQIICVNMIIVWRWKQSHIKQINEYVHLIRIQLTSVDRVFEDWLYT